MLDHMIQRSITDLATGLGFISTYFWFDEIVDGAQGLLVIGGVVIMVLRGWLLVQEIKDRRRKDKKTDGHE